MAAVEIHATCDVEEYAEAALRFLDSEACARSVLRSVIDATRLGGAGWTAPPRFWWVTLGGETAGAAHWTPPFGLAASSLPPGAAARLVRAVRARAGYLAMPLPSVMAPGETAAELAAEWTRQTGEPHHLFLRLLVHELERVVEPRRPPGGPRPARSSDVDLLTRWFVDLVTETGVTGGADPRSSTERAVERGTLSVWENGGVVSFVNRGLPAAGVVRVGPVYTPPRHRGRGYARALTAHCSGAGLEAGANRCMLYTDAANPVSNRIYADIGYVVTGEHAEFRFDRPSDH